MSHLIGFLQFGSHPLSSQSRYQARTPLSALLIGLSHSSVSQRTLWRLSYFPPSTTTCFHPQTNTVSDPDTTTSALLQLTSDIETGFNQRNPPHRTVCVAVDGIRYSQSQRIVIKDCKINTAGGNLSLAVKLHKRQIISYKLQRQMSPTLFSFYLSDLLRG